MIATGKSRPRVGDRAVEVEWCSKMAVDENGDCDHDQCTMSVRLFPNREEALAFAVKTWPETTKTFGIVSIMPIRFVAYDDDDRYSYPNLGYWESAGDCEYVSDDSGETEK